ncbi:MAG: tail fiber assembly protein [Hafnia sp.]
MKNYVYSPSKNLFYPIDLIVNYQNSGDWPDDGIEVEDEVYLEFVAHEPPEGKRRIAGDDGLPVWGVVTPPTREELIVLAEKEKSQLLVIANTAINTLQDAIDLDMATEQEKSFLLEWRKYRIMLNRVDVSNPEWPCVPQG